MSWLPAFISPGPRRRPSGIAAEHRHRRTELIRAAILESLEGAEGEQAASLARRAGAAGDEQRLWHLRVELMSVLASTHGELAAHRKLRDITELFHAFPLR